MLAIFQILSNSVDKFALKCLTRAAITLAKWSTVEESLAKLTSLDSEGADAEIVYLKAAYTSSNVNGTTAICLLKETVLEEAKYVDHWLLLGELCWEQGKSEDALDCFLKVSLTSFTVCSMNPACLLETFFNIPLSNFRLPNWPLTYIKRFCIWVTIIET